MNTIEKENFLRKIYIDMYSDLLAEQFGLKKIHLDDFPKRIDRLKKIISEYEKLDCHKEIYLKRMQETLSQIENILSALSEI